MPRFPPRGPRGRLFPRFDGTIKALRLPADLLAALRFLRLAIPRERAPFAPAAVARLRRRAWGWSPGIPFRVLFRGDGRSSQVPGEPQFPFAHVLRPRPADASLTVAGRPHGPREGNDEDADDKDFRGSIAWLSGWPPTYHDVGFPSPRKAGFQVLVRLSWTGFHPQGSDNRFQINFVCVILLFQAFLAQSPFHAPGLLRTYFDPTLTPVHEALWGILVILGETVPGLLAYNAAGDN